MLTLTWIFRSLGAAQTVLEGRKATEEIFRGADDRLIVVVGYVMPLLFFFLLPSFPTHKISSDPAQFMMSMQRWNMRKS
jgi:hypothetical protein